MSLFQDIRVAVTRTANENYRMWWPSVEVDHESDQFDPKYFGYLKDKLKKRKSGIYIYEFEDNSGTQTLYVGKSKALASRLWNHYRERHNKTGSPNWRKFWSDYKYKMKVYVHAISYNGDDHIDEALRIITERYFIATIKPISESIYKSVK